MAKSLNETPLWSLFDTNRSVKSAKSTRPCAHTLAKKAPRQRLRQLSRLLPTCAALLQAFAAAGKSRSEAGREGRRDGGKKRERGETTQLTEEEGEEHPDKTQRSLHVRDGR